MAHIGRTVKNLEAPRPLKSQSRTHLKNNYMLIEELIQLIENVAMTLGSGISNPEPMALLVQNLRIHGPQLETISKDTLDRAFVTFRNASQDERLNIMTRLNLLELIELRAKGWLDDGINTYYKSKATNVEPDGANQSSAMIDQSTLLSTSPTMLAGQTAQLQQAHLLGPGELIRNSGKFPKPTKIPGKNYCKDEVVIRNADSGKVNPGAKERLVQITGPNEEKINYAKQLIEDTIRRNASPVRLESSLIGAAQGGAVGGGGGAGGSCSSLASSASDEAAPRVAAAGNRTSIGALLAAGGYNANYMVANNPNANMTPTLAGVGNTLSSGKLLRSNNSNQLLLHSFSTNDASLGEYKYTVNVGHHLIKITGDCCDLVRVAKLVLDDYFSSNEFLASFEAGAAFDGSSSIISSTSTPTTPLGAPSFVPVPHQLISSPFADSGIGLNYMAGQISSSINEGDDDVFNDSNASSTPINGLARSRRSHFSRKDSTPEGLGTTNKSTIETTDKTETARIIHEYERLIYYAKSPHSWALPRDWQKICEKHPTLIRNKVTNSSIYTSSVDNSDDKLSTLPPNIVRKGFFNRKTYSIDEGSPYCYENNNIYFDNNSTITTTNVSNICDNVADDNNAIATNRQMLTKEFRSNSTCD